MINGLSQIYKAMVDQSIGHPILRSEGRIEVWESQERKRKIYTIIPRGERFDIKDNYGTIADQVSVNNAIQFMKLDIEMNGNNTNGFRVNIQPRKEPMTITNTSQLENYKPTIASNSFVESIINKQKVLKAASSGTVKSKRKFDLDDLDLDDD